MGLFSKKKAEETVSKKSEQYLLNEELNDITQKIQTVKEEYDTAVSNLMLVKKELNQKKMELDIAQREHREIRDKIKKFELIKESKAVSGFNKTKASHSKTKQELDDVTKKYDKIKKQIVQEESALHSIKNQQIEYEKELDEARSRLYNAKEELEKKDHFQDTSVLTTKEKEFIQANSSNQKSSAGVIEAASAVVGSLKSKLNMAQKELEALQLLLEKERAEHEKTKQELEKLKVSTKSFG